MLRPGGRLAVVAMSRDPHENVMTKIYVWMHRDARLSEQERATLLAWARDR